MDTETSKPSPADLRAAMRADLEGRIQDLRGKVDAARGCMSDTPWRVARKDGTALTMDAKGTARFTFNGGAVGYACFGSRKNAQKLADVWNKANPDQAVFVMLSRQVLEARLANLESMLHELNRFDRMEEDELQHADEAGDHSGHGHTPGGWCLSN